MIFRRSKHLITLLTIELTMKKIYMFESVNNNVSITLDEFQEQYDITTIKVFQGENVINVQLSREDFNDLCNLRYKIDHPQELPALSQELSLVA